jgi:hypothetical protein
MDWYKNPETAGRARSQGVNIQPDRSGVRFVKQYFAVGVSLTALSLLAFVRSAAEGHLIAVSLILFLALAAAIGQIVQIVLCRQGSPAALATAGILAHPLHLLMVGNGHAQALLAACTCISWGVLLLFRHASDPQSFRPWEFGALALLFVGSAALNPDCVFFGFWVLWAMRASLGRLWARIAILGGAFAACSGYWLFQSFGSLHGSYSIAQLRPSFVAMSVGRAIWNSIFPFWMASYYGYLNFCNVLGWGAFLSLCILGWALRKRIGRFTVDLGILAFLLLLPGVIRFSLFDDFIFTDQIYYPALPYLLLLALSLISLTFSTKERVGRILDSSLIVIYLVTGFSFSFLLNSESAAMETCAINEHSDRCMAYMIEQTFAEGGCAATAPWIDNARFFLMSKYRREGYIHTLDVLPFFINYCLISDEESSRSEKMRRLTAKDRIFKNDSLDFFSKGVLLLESGDRAEMWKGVTATYLNERFDVNTLNAGTVNLVRGQLDVLCRKKEFGDCVARQERFKRATMNIPVEGWIVNAGHDVTAKALEVGKKGAASAQ